jgi:DNA-binding IclR family transcriptional regulator
VESATGQAVKKQKESAARSARTGALPKKDRQFVTSLARGLRVLKCFSPSSPELGTAEIARMVRLPQPTVWRLCHTLVRMDFLTTASGNDKLRLGLPVLGLGYTVLAGDSIAEMARPYMQSLAERYQGAVSLSIREGLNMMFVQRVHGTAIVRTDLRIGSRLPLGYSAGGWAYLAGLTSERQRELIVEIRAAGGSNWGKTERKFRAALKGYKKRGFIVYKGLYYGQINSVSVPVKTRDGAVRFALASGGIANIFDDERLKHAGNELRELAIKLGNALPHADSRA